MTKAQTEREQDIIALREMLKPGDTVYTILKHVSRSGMSRDVELYVIKDNEPLRITWKVAGATGMRFDKERETIKVNGCGMDVGFEVVYNLGRALWPNGFAVGGRGRNGDMSGWDKDGGYALKHRWM